MSSAIRPLIQPRVPTLTQAFDIISPEQHYRASAGRCDHKPLKTQSHREFWRQTREDAEKVSEERPRLFRWRTQSNRIYKNLYPVIRFKKTFFSVSPWVSLASRANKIFSLELCSRSFPFFASLSWRRSGSVFIDSALTAVHSQIRPEENSRWHPWRWGLGCGSRTSLLFSLHILFSRGPDLRSRPT